MKSMKNTANSLPLLSNHMILDTAEIIVIYWDGVVTSKRGNSLSVWVPSLNQAVSLALPYYPPSNYVENPFTLRMAGQHHRTETIEDIEALFKRRSG